MVGPLAIFDAEVIDQGSVDVNMRDAQGAVLDQQTWAAVVVDDVDMIESMAADPYDRSQLEQFLATTEHSPIELLHADGWEFSGGQRYRFFLWRFGLSTDADFMVGFAWDLDQDEPVRGAVSANWRADLEDLRDAGLVEGTNANVIVDVARAFNDARPVGRHRDIVVTLLGESMLPTSNTTAPVTTG